MMHHLLLEQKQKSHGEQRSFLLQWDSVQISSIIYAELSITGSFEWEDGIVLTVEL